MLDGCRAGGVNASGNATVTVVPSSILLCTVISPACKADQAFHDRQPEAGAFVPPLIGLAGLEERIADPLEIVGRDADAGIGDAKHQPRSLDRGGNRHRAAALGELDGIGDEIQHDLLERARIAGHDGQILGRAGHEIDAVFPRLQRQQVAAIEQCRARRERLRRNLEIAGFHLGHVEDAVDHRQQMLAGIVDQLGIFLAARRIQHQRVFLNDHFGEADDGVERRAQFVAHGGEKAALGRVGLLGGGARQIERLFLDFAVGDVAHHGDDLGFGRSRRLRRLLQRPATHLDPDEIDRIVLAALAAARRIAPEAKFDAARLAAARRVRKRREIGRTIGDMDAVEQAVPEQPRRPAFPAWSPPRAK